MKEPVVSSEISTDIRILSFGEGKLIVNWGTYDGTLAVFIEVAKEAGSIGAIVEDGKELHIRKDGVSAGATVLTFTNKASAGILLEDIRSAIEGL